MRPDDLRTFLHLIEQADQLARVPVMVDPRLELATIVDCAGRGQSAHKALLFEQVYGSGLPVAVNLFGSMERIAWAFGTTDLEGLAERLEQDLEATGKGEPVGALQTLCAADAWQPTVSSRPEWRLVGTGRVGLGILPRIVAWPGDGGPFLTLAQVFTRHPQTGVRNCGMYRVQYHEHGAATLRCRAGSGAARHLAAWHERHLPMPVAVVLGGPPVLAWAAGAPLPEGVEEAAFCGYLTGRRLEMSVCPGSDLQVPASAEVVIEGVIAPGATAVEGPFGNHTGGYDAEPAAPLMEIVAVHARPGAIYPWTLVGPPPRENVQLARASERLLLPLLKMALPSLRALHMPGEGIFHRAALVTVDAAEQRPAAELAGLLWATPLLNGARLLVVGAADHDPHDIAAVFWRTLNRADWSRDLLVSGQRMVIDARRRPPGEPVRSDPAVLEKVLGRWQEYRID